jgi:hypothetical protein
LTGVGLASDQNLVDGLLAEAGDHAVRVELERGRREDLAATGLPRYELPALVEGMDLGGLYRLTDELREQWAVRR